MKRRAYDHGIARHITKSAFKADIRILLAQYTAFSGANRAFVNHTCHEKYLLFAVNSELKIIKTLIHSAKIDKIIVRAAFQNLALCYNGDLIGVANG